MSINLQLLLNDKYKVLKFLNDNTIQVGNEHFIPLNQQEIARSMNFSIMKTNAIMVKLKDMKLVTSYRNTRGRYMLTEEAKKIIYGISQLDKKEVNNNDGE